MGPNGWHLAVLLHGAFVSASIDIGNPVGTVAGSLVNVHHYGDPKGGCLPDEHNITVEGIGGDLCSPKCSPKSKTPCPTDVPSGVTAQPHCEITYQDKTKGCCLICSPSTDVASLRAGDAQCGAGSCQPIQGVGVCTYGGPTPSGLPDSCTASSDGTIVCVGDASPEPGCERINKLCCANVLPDAFAKLARYKEKHPFQSLSFTCGGDFGGGDAKWGELFGSLVQNITGLHTLALDFTFNAGASDGLVLAIESALAANPGLTNVSLGLEGSNISDAGAALLGQVLQKHLGHTTTALYVNFRRNAADTEPTYRSITAEGAGKLAAGIGKMSQLKNLTLQYGYCTNMTYKGIATVAAGLQPLQDKLQYLNLDFGYSNVVIGSGAKPFPAFACLGKVLGGFKQLHTLVLNLDYDIDEPGAVQNLGIHLACLPVMEMILPGMDNDKTECHCGLAVDAQKKCLIPNKNYPQLGTACFECLPHANATSCEAFSMQWI